jgi:hypothetical protein
MTKSKPIFIFVSLALTAASVWIYIGQKPPRLRKTDSESAVKARLKGYELFRYKGDELRARVSGKKASLIEPSTLVCEDDIIGFRTRNGLREQASARRAIVKFAGESLFNQKDSTLDTIELDGNVDFQRGRSQFMTEWISYTEKTSEAFTEKPVRMESSGQFVAAEGGMTYHVRDESIRLRGGVFGNIRTDVIRSGIDIKGSN